MEHLKVTKVERVLVCPSSWPLPSTSSTEPEQKPGILHLTPHHLVFSYEDQQQDQPEAPAEELWLPVPLLLSLTLHPPSSAALTPLVCRTRDFRVFTLLFKDHVKAQEVYGSVKALVHNSTLQSLHAFAHSPDVDAQFGWNVYDVKKELERMGALGQKSQAWRLSDVNRSFDFCDTYPASLAVPARIGDATLRYGKSYRSKSRIPALVYLHWANLGSITRASQPMVGLKNARSIQDEKLIEAIFHSHAQHSSSAVYGAKASNLIIDARPTTNAVANSVKGAGTENMEHYKDCRKAYLGIDNIHVMRDSLRALTETLVLAEGGHLDRAALKRTGWLKHLSAILEGAILIAKNVHLSNSHVLVHCSDGWDRTAQLSALAQLCLDPYYRTIEGFAVLIEKDWLSFGHKFGHRSGHLVPERTNFSHLPGEGVSAQAAFLSSMQKGFAFSSADFKETSPVFHQFLDCVYQILKQCPKRFEFDQRFLQDLYRQLYSCEWGTFVFDSELHRSEYDAKHTTRSVWQRYLASDEVKAKWTNPDYDSSHDDPMSRAPGADQGVLLPDPKKLTYWFELFNRSDDDMNAEEPESSLTEPAGTAEPPVVAIVDAQGAPAPQVASEKPDGLVDNINKVSISSASPKQATSPDSGRSPRSSVPSSPAQRAASPPASQSNAGISAAPAWAAAAQPAFNNAVSSMWKFGGSSWKTLQKGYQDTMKDLHASASTPEASPAPTESSQRPTLGNLGSQFDPWRSKSTMASSDPSKTHSAPSSEMKAVTELEATGSAAPRLPPRFPSQANPWGESEPELSSTENDSNSKGDPLGVGL